MEPSPPDHLPDPVSSDPAAAARYKRYVTAYNTWFRLYHAAKGAEADPKMRWPMILARLAYQDAKLDYLFPDRPGPPDTQTPP